tara:strand:- start:678 stop:1427 length:750 start_codon:yes stop_codon:yes gene_type:complete
MPNSNYNIAGIEEQSKAFFTAGNNQVTAVATMLGLVWSPKTARHIKEGKAMINRGDLSFNKSEHADNTKFHALQRGYVNANTEKFGTVGLAGFTTLELFEMTREDVKNHKLALCNGNKKPATKSQAKAFAAFQTAQRTTANRISSGMANLRNKIDEMLGTPKVEKPNKTPKQPTAKGKDTQTGSVSPNTEVESGSEAEVKSTLPPTLVDPDLIRLVNAFAQCPPEQQAWIAKSIRKHIIPAAKPRPKKS